MNRHFGRTAAAVAALAVLSGPLAAGAAQSATPAPGTILTVAGDGKLGFSGDGGPATMAAFNSPLDQVVDASGNLFIADAFNNRVRKVSPDGIIATVVGIGPTGEAKGGLAGDGGPVTQARLWIPSALVLDNAGSLFISDFGNNRVRKVDPAGMITTVAHVSYPQQMTLGSAGDLYVVETFGWFGGAASGRVRKVDSAGAVTTVAGGGHPADGRGDGGLATDARFRLPEGIALDHSGNLFIADFADNRVRRVRPDGTIVTIAGGGQPADGVGDGGPATGARLEGPAYITMDAGGNLFIAENRGERIRKVSPAGIITTVAGTGQMGYTGDNGPATAARLNSPVSVFVDRAGNLFFTDGYRYTADGLSIEKAGEGNMVVREVIGAAVPG